MIGILPEGILSICEQLRQNGYEAVIVGGAVRNYLMGLPIKDWDIATNASPECILGVLPASRPTGLRYGTVTAGCLGCVAQVTTYRIDGPYLDGRHPSCVQYVSDLKADLSRRDFTINALAFEPFSGRFIDLFGGMSDLRNGLIRAVGIPHDRFRQDALRMLRAIRFSAQLGFQIEHGTLVSFVPEQLDLVSPERVRNEFTLILQTDRVCPAMELLSATRLLHRFLPELAPCGGTTGSADSLQLLKHSAKTASLVQPALRLRLAALLHDIGRTPTVAPDGSGRVFTHNGSSTALSARVALERLRYPGRLIRGVTSLVANHGTRMDHAMSDKSLRRLIRRIGPELMPDLIALRAADLAAGCMNGTTARQKNTEPFDSVLLTRRVREIIGRGDPLAIGQLALNGDDIIRLTGWPPGPAIGRLLRRLFLKTLENPELNRPEILAVLVRQLSGQNHNVNI